MSEGVRPVASTMVGRMGARLLGRRALVRAPIWIYRARLGFLFSARTLMLEHTGRVSGARRYVVLEVIARPAPDRYIVASGFGTRAQWCRNVMAEPAVRVSVGAHGPRPGTAHLLPAAEADAALADYAARHPRAWAALKNVVEHTLGAPVDVGDTALPMIELRLAG